MTTITGFETYDVRFPTSRTLAGSDAMNTAPDYSAAYVVIRTDAPDPELAGHGFAFTIGRGNDVQLAAIALLEPFLAGRDLDEVLAGLGGLGRALVSDSPLHWLGPSAGVMHMAAGAVMNACWDLAARRAGKPLWLLLAEMSPEQICGLVDFRYLTDALTPGAGLVVGHGLPRCLVLVRGRRRGACFILRRGDGPCVAAGQQRGEIAGAIFRDRLLELRRHEVVVHRPLHIAEHADRRHRQVRSGDARQRERK